ncbi:MAG: hypothetical protein J5J00_12745 [Deltaproteobacteria bacterium]|nr:hypothetical protein [Deltaproteobacteria bacterium]
MRVKLAAFLILAGSLTTAVSCRTIVNTFALGGYYRLQEAEELTRQGRFDDAIEAYKSHMQARLRIAKRPEWENPYFYYLLIGDLELARGNDGEAIGAYQEAFDNGIHRGLISDRYRYVANWYEEKGDLEKAYDLLKLHRELDPLLFDAMLDRISKEIIRTADLQSAPATPAASDGIEK